MEFKNVNGIRVCFEADCRQAAAVFEDACLKSIPILRELWGLEIPRNCRVYVMTSWQGFMFRAFGWPVKIGLALTLPLWALRVKRQWPLVAGWTYRLRNGAVVGVKPPALLAAADTRLGQRVYFREPDLNRRVQNALCHELAHAFTGQLRLPLWLNEGIAMVTADRFAGKATIRPETIVLLEKTQPKTGPAGYRNLMSKGDDGIVYNYVRGYWIVRSLEWDHPGLVKGLLEKRRTAGEIESRIGQALGLERERLWRDIDGLITARLRIPADAARAAGERPRPAGPVRGADENRPERR